MNAYRNLPPDANLEAWLVTIAHRKAVDIIRSRKRQPVLTDVVPEAAGPRDAVDFSDLHWAVDRLPNKQRQAIAYHYLAGLPYNEVAEILGGTAAAARRAASDGIAALRRTYAVDRAKAVPARKGETDE